MLKPMALKGVLFLTSALALPTAGMAQAAAEPENATPAVEETTDNQPVETAADDADADQPDVSIPGSSLGNDIVVVGRRRDITRDAPQVVAVLSSEDIARTGDGDIAGALARVTGLSVVGNGFVFVRGLGDRYSLALLNGSPLPSPEPLKRTVPLDLFPTSIIASSLVQKSYSVNFPGEFGGGVINLTTVAIPQESFVSVGFGGTWDTESTNQLGYTYFGSASDFTGFDNGSRDLPPVLSEFLATGQNLSFLPPAVGRAIATELVRASDVVLQRVPNQAASYSGSINAGTSIELGEAVLGIIGTLGYSNKLTTRDAIQQSSADLTTNTLDSDFRRVTTDNRIVVNSLLGFGLEFGENTLRWTNVYIRDTLKQARLGQGTQSDAPLATILQQDTAFYERQLIDTQIVAELRPLDNVSLDLRGGFANSQREAPNEFSFEYFRSNDPNDVFGEQFINLLNNGQRGRASVAFSDLTEDLYSAGVDIGYKFNRDLTATVGYAFSDTKRRTANNNFQFLAPTSFPIGVGLLRPDFLLQPDVINTFGINLVDNNISSPVFDASLVNHGGYGQIQANITPDLALNIGVRYETAEQTVAPAFESAVLAATNLNNDYWLPAATLTYKISDTVQLRFNASKTIARPQFRELVFQNYVDPDTNRQFRGNPLLTDSELLNAEARVEWFFDRDQRFSVTAFAKRIDKPIETFASFSDTSVISSFANAPTADLYGAEVDVQKYFKFESSESKFWDQRRVVLVANYTYTQSNVKVGAGDTVGVFGSSATLASDFFRDGGALTGQSDHLVNLQLGLEDTDRLSQQTLLFSYASERVTNRGASSQPDIIERPGIQLDFVAREGIKLAGAETELKFEVRNILGTGYEEFQDGETLRVFANQYDVGTTISASISLKF